MSGVSPHQNKPASASLKRWLFALALSGFIAGSLSTGSTPLVPHGDLSTGLTGAPHSSEQTLASKFGNLSFPLGDFTLTLDDTQQARLTIKSGTKLVFDSGLGRSFVSAARARDGYRQGRGMLILDDQTRDYCTKQSILGVNRSGNAANRAVTLRGHLACADGPLEYTATFEARPNNSAVLGYQITLGPDAVERGYNRTILQAVSSADEAFMGFGQQFSRFNFKGQRVPILVSEQGIGRGKQPLTFAANMLYDGAGGDAFSAYAPIPQTLTNKGRGLFAATYATAEFDLRRADQLALIAHDQSLSGGLIAGDTVLDMISSYTALIGRQRPLPDWVMDGAILGLQGGTQAAQDKLDMMRQNGTPVAALWLQDWVGQRITSFGKQLWWSWTLDETRYPGWDDFVAVLRRDDVRVLGYINPFLTDTKEWENATGKRRKNLLRLARNAGYLVKEPDGQGPYLERNTDFDFGILDMTHPGARDFAARLIRDEMVERGFSGWMADFGEALPLDGRIRAQAPMTIAHNSYPDMWAEVNRDAIREAGLEREAFVFHRAGHYLGPKNATAYWLGDQLVSWDAQDGFRSAIVGHLTSGISGHAITHADIGGYTAIKNPLLSYIRSPELLARWAEFATFTAVFRTHEGNLPDDNTQVFSSQKDAKRFARMATLYTCLKPYRQALNNEVRDHGWPMVRHPLLHYPDEAAYSPMTYQQVMMGDAIMLAPVSAPGVDRAEIILPKDSGQWVHLWTGELFGAGKHTVAAPIGSPAAFVREASPFATKILQCVSRGAPVNKISQ